MSSQRMQKVEDLLRELNEYGEHERIEAKMASEAGKSILETVCAFANEPGLGGGHLLLGVVRGERPDLFETQPYEVIGVENAEQVGDDLASQCASSFNRPLRPRIEPVSVQGKTVVHVRVEEATPGEKPVYFGPVGLPHGAFRRIGATDQHCTDDDLQVFYDARSHRSYDFDVVQDAKASDIDPDAVEEYRDIRRDIAPEAEEHRFDYEDLLLALNGVREVDGDVKPTVAGILLFGTPLALRRFFPMTRVDYIRVPGREWMPDPEERYTSVSIRAPLIRAVRRTEAAVLDDLPKAFNLPEGSLHRQDVPPLPRAVLREAIVNAVMHRDYRVHGAVQVIRYSNRIEIKNPGYSLKAPERLGKPGSQTRNPHVAAVFHDTNLAETKGTGVRVMRRLMKKAELVPPTFESNRAHNAFTGRLILHHFLSEADLAWLDALGEPSLNAKEKLALVFVREVGAMDNPTYRDLTGVETLRASADLRHLCELNLLEKKGQSTATYYVPGARFEQSLSAPTAEAENPAMPEGKPDMAAGKPTMPEGNPSMADGESSMPESKPTMPESKPDMAAGKPTMLPDELQPLVEAVGGKADEDTMRTVIRRLCAWRSLSAEELAALVGRNARYLKTRYLKPMVRESTLALTIPEMPKHPRQAYQTPNDDA